MRGSVSKRCPCPVTYSATGRRRACKKDHGSWYYVVDLGRGPDGKRRQERRGGYHTRDEAEEAMAAVIKTVGEGTHAHDGRLTVGEFLDHWLTDKVAAGLRPTTERSYRQHIRDHLTPQLGHLRLRDLRPNHVAALLRTVAQGQPGKPAPGPASVRRVHATLRSALTSAHRQQLVAFNAAANLDLPAAARPKVRPWEPAELGRFLDSIGGNRLAPLFELIAATGLRRGEACGLRWSDVDLGRGVVVVRQQLVQVTVDEHMPKCTCCGEVHKGLMIGPPKTKAGESRAVELDGGTIGVLLAHRLAQDAERLEWGRAYTDHGLVFARENGSPLPPRSCHQAVPRARRRGGAAADPTARPPARRGVAHAGGRCGPRSRLQAARPQLDQHHERHLLASLRGCRPRGGRASRRPGPEKPW